MLGVQASFVSSVFSPTQSTAFDVARVVPAPIVELPSTRALPPLRLARWLGEARGDPAIRPLATGPTRRIADKDGEPPRRGTVFSQLPDRRKAGNWWDNWPDGGVCEHETTRRWLRGGHVGALVGRPGSSAIRPGLQRCRPTSTGVASAGAAFRQCSGRPERQSRGENSSSGCRCGWRGPTRTRHPVLRGVP